jgi:hypothetical protein
MLRSTVLRRLFRVSQLIVRLTDPFVLAGYATFFPKLGSYDLKGAPSSWAKVVAMRHAMTKYPDATYIWYLEQDSFIMNPSLKVEDIMKPARLESLMIKDHPVVPPDSIIKTFAHLKGGDVEFVLTQDKDGLSTGSFLVRNGEWAEFFLETWFDPIYRSYNFQKAETHALVGFSTLLLADNFEVSLLTNRLARAQRSTLFNGTRPYCRSCPWSRRTYSTRTATARRVSSTPRATWS